jgi:uncharacterized protein (TIGR00255 family)
MKSMTGFGVGEAPLGEGRVLLELRSLNHRFLEVRVRLPAELFDQGSFMEQIARERLTRGRFDLSVRLEGNALPPAQFGVERVRAAYRTLLALRDELAPGTELPLTSVASLPDVITPLSSYNVEYVQDALRAAFEAAASRLSAMRIQEGQALRREFDERLSSARELLRRITARTAERVDIYRARLKERLERLLADSALRLEPGRLELEVAILADRSDVTEELVRLESHFGQLEHLLAEEAAVGRRIEFLLQEIAREANTVGSKSQDAALSHVVVDLKAEIERMREQVQNVE